MTAGVRTVLTRPFHVSGWFPLLMALAGMLLVMVAAWQLTGISFKPYDALVLEQAAFYPDSGGVCSPSISDSLAYASDVPEPIATQLLNCVRQLGRAGAQGREVQLPHEWRTRTDSFPELMSGRGLYRISLDLGGNQPVLYGLYLPAINSNAAVFLNDVLLGWGGSFEQPVARNATRPMLFSIPAGLLREGRNWIDVYVVAEPVPRGFLDKLYLAPIEVLEAAYHEHGIFRHEIPRAIALSLLVISLFIGVLWFYRRRETEYGLFALASLCWAVNAMDQFVVDIPLPVFYWDWLMMLSLSGFVFLGVMFVHRFLHEAHPQVERLMLMIGVPVVLLCLVLPRTYAYLVVLYVWNPVLLVYGAYVLLFILHKIGQQYASRELYALVLAIAVIFIFASYDFTVQMGWRSQVNGMFLHFGAPVLMLSFTWILLRRFVSSLQATETYNRKLLTLNQELEQRVAERGRRIAESYETIRQFEQREVLLNERSRIMRDMHDGIGVYLTSMLRQLDTASIDREQLRDSARNALNDLRLMIDSLGNASTDLSAMLGMFRTRISAVLDACGMELEWAVDELPQVADFGPERALNLLRILQEAVTNAVKHSGSERVSLSAGTELQPGRSNRIKIEIRDNGKGFVDERPGGNGLKNMQYRAKKIQAELAVSSDGQGTSVTVYLPVAAGQGDSMTLAQSGGRLNGVAGTRKK